MALHFFHTPEGALTLYSHRHSRATNTTVHPAIQTDTTDEADSFIIPAVHSGKALLVLQPFAEESNRCRYMWPQLASQLGDLDTFVLDGWGCGDSAGDFSEASIRRWRAHLQLFIQKLQQLGYRELRFLAVRFGALQLLDLLSFGPLPLPVSQVLLWQPLLQSQTFLTQWLRLKQANVNSNPATDSPKALRAQLEQGLTIDIAGYALTPAFYQELEQLQPRLAPCFSALRVDSIYTQPPQAAAMKANISAATVSSATQNSHYHSSFAQSSIAHPSHPASTEPLYGRTVAQLADTTNASGAALLPAALATPLANLNAYLATPVTSHVITGAPYWMQSERVDISALVALSVQLLQTYRPAMPQQTKMDSARPWSSVDNAPLNPIDSMETLGFAATDPCSIYTTKPPTGYLQQLWSFDVPRHTAGNTADTEAEQSATANKRGNARLLALHTVPAPVGHTSPPHPIGTVSPTDVTTADATLGVLILVGGHQYRVGAHRQFTQLSRHLAQHGFCSLRIDVPGMGDNPGSLAEFYQHDIYIKAALDHWQQQQPQLQHFVIWGLCDAASSALIYQHSYQDARLVGMVLLNPWLRQPQQQAQVMLQNYYGQKLTDRQWWLKLLRGQVHIRQSIQEVMRTWWRSRTPTRASAKDDGKHPHKQSIKPQVTADNYVQVMYEGWHGFSGKTLVLCSGADFTAQEFLLYCEQQPKWHALLRQAELHTLADANHTFAREDWRVWVEQQTLEFLQQLIVPAKR